MPKHTTLELNDFLILLIHILVPIEGIPAGEEGNILQVIKVVLVEATEDNHGGANHARGVASAAFGQLVVWARGQFGNRVGLWIELE